MDAERTFEPELRQLLDERAIRTVILRYCRGVDRMDRDLVRSCYHPDAVDSHAHFEGALDDFLDWAWTLQATYTSTMHYVANLLVEHHPTDPDLAHAETYGIALQFAESGDRIGGFRYLDRFERRTGEWRIARRDASTEWVREAGTGARWTIPPEMLTGRRDRDDLVYRPWA